MIMVQHHILLCFEKSSAAQKERIEKKAVEKKEAKKTAQKKAEKKRMRSGWKRNVKRPGMSMILTIQRP